MSDLFLPSFWEEAWLEAAAADRARGRVEAAAAWSGRAKSYDKNVDSESGRQRVTAVLEFLVSNGALGGKMKILDIGCGPGAFALAFARLGHDVTALDPAEKMLELLQEKLARERDLAGTVVPLQDDWTELSPDDYGWRGHFDLVFASMTPGIRDVATLKKAMTASRRFVYLSSFAGPRTMPSLEAVWRELHGTPYRSYAVDILYPLNWLYTSGYFPVVRYHRWEREHRQTLEEATAEVLEILSMRMHLDEETRSRVQALMAGRSDRGLVTEKKGATAAMLLWRVDREPVETEGCRWL